jgi:SprT protein
MSAPQAPKGHGIAARAEAMAQTAASAARLAREARAAERTRALLALGATLIQRRVPGPQLRFDLRGQAAGQFRIDAAGRPAIRYNADLMARHEEEFLAQTVPHEVAHYLAYLRHGRAIRPHGPQWQTLMRGLGADPRRCHDFDVSDLSARRLQRYAYHCRCAEHELTSIRHRRTLRGATYLCRACGEALRPGPRPARKAENG